MACATGGKSDMGAQKQIWIFVVVIFAAGIGLGVATQRYFQASRLGLIECKRDGSIHAANITFDWHETQAAPTFDQLAQSLSRLCNGTRI